MRLDYVVADPTGNITLLVLSPVTGEQRAAAAKKLLAAEPAAEQLGFVQPPEDGADTALYMAGGEFCGNAALAVAALCLQGQGKTAAELRVQVSGREVMVALRQQSPDSYRGSVGMPRAECMERQGSLTRVQLPGITHYVTEEPMTDDRAEQTLRALAQRGGDAAVGLMQLDQGTGTLKPLVYVPGADTMFWEHSCASGTAAAGLYLAAEYGDAVDTRLKEPAGALGVTVDGAGRVTIHGNVKLGAVKTAEL